MSTRITTMNAGQGFTANFVTALLVLGASRLGLPVSTTHVSCGALFGLGAATGQARWDVIAQISLAWVTTLPVAVLCAAGAWLFFSRML
jgi:PiT family inorganic phosphate transporter